MRAVQSAAYADVQIHHNVHRNDHRSYMNIVGVITSFYSLFERMKALYFLKTLSQVMLEEAHYFPFGVFNGI